VEASIKVVTVVEVKVVVVKAPTIKIIVPGAEAVAGVDLITTVIVETHPIGDLVGGVAVIAVDLIKMTAALKKSYHLDFKDQEEQVNGRTMNIVVGTIIGITEEVVMFSLIFVITKLMTLVCMITKKTMTTMNSLV